MKVNFDGQAIAMVFLTVFFTACTFVAKKWFSSDAALAIEMGTWIGVFGGALLRHFNGPAAQTASPLAAQEQPSKIKEIA